MLHGQRPVSYELYLVSALCPPVLPLCALLLLPLFCSRTTHAKMFVCALIRYLCAELQARIMGVAWGREGQSKKAAVPVTHGGSDPSIFESFVCVRPPNLLIVLPGETFTPLPPLSRFNSRRVATHSGPRTVLLILYCYLRLLAHT